MILVITLVKSPPIALVSVSVREAMAES